MVTFGRLSARVTGIRMLDPGRGPTKKRIRYQRWLWPLSRLCLTLGPNVFGAPNLPGGGWPLRAGTGELRDLMASDAARVDALVVRGRSKRTETIVLGLGAVAIALGAAAWIADTGRGLSQPQPCPGNPQLSSFDDRFSPLSQPTASRGDVEVPAQDRFASATLELQLLDARSLLGRGLTGGQWRSSTLQGTPLASGALRSIEAAQTVEIAPRAAARRAHATPASDGRHASRGCAGRQLPQPEDRSFFQKLSDLLPSGGGGSGWRR